MWSRNFIIHYKKFASQIVKRYSQIPPKEKLKELIATDISQFKIGDQFHGFEVKNIQTISEFDIIAYRLEHEATGAEYLHLFRNDPCNVFAACFRTTPMDSKGAPHILEHTVLCGSEMFPIRDPFFKMLARSLATYMNAMTGPDFTYYPFGTQNETDFRNLQKVYLDAVFRPNINKSDFMQEGWRFAHEDPKNTDSPIIIKGIVYNEMKGVLAENEHILHYKILNNLLPDHTYRFISGGDPLDIPNLTWENLKQFHQVHYHPSNAKFYSYGNFPVLPTLEYINEHYLTKCKKIDVSHTIVPRQSRWEKEKRIHTLGRFEKLGPKLEKQNVISVSYAMSDVTDINETFILQFISHLLISGPNSPFYKSLIESKKCAGFTPSTGFQAETRESIFTLGMQGIEKEKFDELVKVVDETIDKVIETGFEPKHVESVLHQYELSVRNQPPNFGIHILFEIATLWNHNGDVIKALQVNSLINTLLNNIKNDPKFLQNYVRKYFKNNSHRLIVTMSPDPEYDTKFKSLEEKLLSEKTKSLSDEIKNDIHAQDLKLLEAQDSKQSTEILPTLTMSDIKKSVVRDNIIKTFCGPVPTQLCNVNTNGILYFRGILSTAELTPEQTMMLPLFCYVIDKLGTATMDHLKFDNLVSRKTAGLNFSLHIGESLHHLHSYEPGIAISSFCLNKNAPDMWNLWNEIFSMNELKDIERFEMLVQLYVTNLTHGIVNLGHVYAMTAASGIVSGSAYQKDQLTGLQHITYMTNLVNTSNYRAMLQELSKIARILFDKNKLRCALNASEETMNDLYKDYEKFITNLPGSFLGSHNESIYVTPKIWSPIDSVHCQHYELNIPVYFCSKSILTAPYVDPDYATLKILAKLLSSKYLHPMLREKRGAYGAGAVIGPDGVLKYYSYRDPQNLSTLDVFDESYKWVNNEIKNITEQDIIEAKLGVFQAVDAPLSPSQRGYEEFKRGLTADILQKHRSELMAVDVDKLKEANEKFLGEHKDAIEGKVIIGPMNKNMDVANRRKELWTVVNAN